jgi:hypothetical protein
MKRKLKIFQKNKQLHTKVALAYKLLYTFRSLFFKCIFKVALLKGWLVLSGNSLVVFYYLSASEVWPGEWPYKINDLCGSGLLRLRGTAFSAVF